VLLHPARLPKAAILSKTASSLHLLNWPTKHRWYSKYPSLASLRLLQLFGRFPIFTQKTTFLQQHRNASVV
jgi:hypothetical protein